jgi:WD40 repeat protein
VKDRSRLAVNINSPGFVLGAGSKLRQLRCALSPDASIVAVTNPTDNSVRLFNGTTGDIMDRLSPGDQPIMTAVFSPDGRELGVADEAGAVFVIETGLTPVVREFEGHDESVNGLDFSQDGSRLVTCSSDLTAKIWDSRTTELILTLPEHHTDDLTAVAWSPVGDQITTASLDGSLIVWSAETGEILSVMHGHRGPVLDLVYSPSGELIYSGGSDRTVRMWEASTGRELRVFNGHEAGVRGLVGLSEGGVASVDAAGVIRCWDRRWDASVTSVEGCEEMSFGKIAFGAQNMMVHGATGTRRLEVMDGAEARHVGPLFGEAVGAEVGAAHGTFARATAADILAVATNDGRVLIYDSEGLQLIQEFKGFNESVTLMEISADGQVLVACGRRRDPVIIDMATKRRTEIGLRSAVTALALSEDGRYAAFAENDESIRVFDTDSGTVVGAHRDSHSNRITDLAISADGELLASVSNDKTARLWSMPTLEFHGSELPVHREQVTCVEFSPTEGRLATGSADGRIRVHDIDNQAVVFTLLAHERPILDLCFSSDGKRLAAAGLQSGVKIWETGEASGRYQSRFGRAESDEN